MDLFVMDLIEKRIDLRRIKTGLAKVKVAILNILQKLCQKILIPCSGDLIKRNVQRLLSYLVDIHDRAGNFGVAEVYRHCQPLMATDDRHIAVHHKRICKAELLDAVFYLFVLLIPGF